MRPEWWGALGDETTDDSAAFTDAINATLNTGIEIHLLPRTYRIGFIDVEGTRAVTPGDVGPHFVGSSDSVSSANIYPSPSSGATTITGGTILQASATATTYIFKLGDSSPGKGAYNMIYRATFENLAFEGNGRACGGVFLSAAGFCKFHNVVFDNMNYCIALKHADRLTMTKCNMYSSNYGFYYDMLDSAMDDGNPLDENCSGISLIDIHHRSNDYNMYLLADRTDFQIDVRGGYWTSSEKADVYVTGGAKMLTFDGVNFENTTNGILEGTHDTGNGTTLTDTSNGSTWTDGELAGMVIRNNTQGLSNVILTNTSAAGGGTVFITQTGAAATITWALNDEYTILAKPAIFHLGLKSPTGTPSSASTTNVLVDTTASWVTNEFVGFTVERTNASGGTSTGTIASNQGMTVTTPSGVAWTSTDTYSIINKHIGIDTVNITNCMFQDNNSSETYTTPKTGFNRSILAHVVDSEDSSNPSVNVLNISNNVMRNMASSEARGIDERTGAAGLNLLSSSLTTNEYTGRYVGNVTTGNTALIFKNTSTVMTKDLLQTWTWSAGDEYAASIVDAFKSSQVRKGIWENNVAPGVKPPAATGVWKKSADSDAIGLGNAIHFGTRLYECPSFVPVVASTTGLTVRVSETGGIYTNTGANTVSIMTHSLTAASRLTKGQNFRFVTTTATNTIRVDPDDADGFLRGSGLGKYVQLTSTLGSEMEVTLLSASSGTVWQASATVGTITYE